MTVGGAARPASAGPSGAPKLPPRPGSRNSARGRASPRKSPLQGLKKHIVNRCGLKVSACGVGFRRSKSMEDRDGFEHVKWGNTVMGIDEGDGWLKVRNRYLPMTYDGVQVVMTLEAHEEVLAQAAKAARRAKPLQRLGSAATPRRSPTPQPPTIDEETASNIASERDTPTPTLPSRPPTGLSQHMVQISYRKFQRRSGGDPLQVPTPPPGGFRPPSTPDLDLQALPPAYRRLPVQWRPPPENVLDMAEETGMTTGEALATCLVGTVAQEALQGQLPNGSSRGEPDALDLPAAVHIVKSSVAFAETINVEHVLAAIGSLEGSRNIEAVNASNMDLHECCDLLRLLPALLRLDLSRNPKIDCIASLRACERLQVVDLSGCSKLRDVQPLGTLAFLRAVDLSRCTEIEDVSALLLNDPHSARRDYSEAVQLSARTAPGSARLARNYEAKFPLGHPTLEYLSLSGCRHLCKGIEHLPCCQKLTHVDLFDCSEADVAACYEASRAPQIRIFVWPGNRGMLESLAQAQAWSRMRLLNAAAAATAAATEKLAMAQDGGRRGSGLPPLCSKQGNLELIAAKRCARGFGIEVPEQELKEEREKEKEKEREEEHPTKVPHDEVSMHANPMTTSELSLASTLTEVDEEEDDDEERRRELPERITTMGFLRAMRSDKFDVSGPALLDLFHVLDADGDGALSLQDLLSFDRGLPAPEEMNEAVALLLARHSGLPDGAAADLGGGRERIDGSRVQECLRIAGASEALAAAVPAALEHCSQGLLIEPSDSESVEKGLCHALGAYTVAYTAALATEFRAFVLKKFGTLEDAFVAFDTSKSEMVDFDGFSEACRKKLQWPPAERPGVLEAVWRVLADKHDNECAAADDFTRLANFNAEETLESMVTIGRMLQRFPADRQKHFGKSYTHHGVRQTMATKETARSAALGPGIKRSDFVKAWESLVRHDHSFEHAASMQDLGTIVFGLLDVYNCNVLTAEEIALLTDGLQRRAETLTLRKFKAFVKKNFGSMEEAFLKWSQGELAPVEIHFKTRDSRRSSSSRHRSRSSSSSKR